jgi:decaprenylphospho-beta-D-ribofuranose 2-oxidase
MEKPMSTDYASTRLTGWGLTAPSVARVATVVPSDLAACVKDSGVRGVIARGLGRSYGDAAQNSGGSVLRVSGSISDVVVDRASATVTASAAVSLDDLLKVIVPQGFFVPVTPGTRFVTVGGAIASDIHGKNHHADGSFGVHVRRLSLLLADGTVRELSPTLDPELFWATVGGMGLTGIILDATFAVIPIETSRCVVSTIRCDDLDELLSEMSVGDDEHRYSVSWVDLLARGRSFGRGVLWRGDHARASDLDAKQAVEPLKYEPKHLATVPPIVPPPGFVNLLTSRLFNELWLRKEPRRKDGQIKSIPGYFHPLDSIGSWNRLYGPRGFIQYQFVVPFEREDALRRCIEMVVESRLASPLVVLKRFGAANRAPLSFPMPGWTLTVDMPAGADGLSDLCRRLDDVVLEAGGRHYLAKDAHTRAESIVRGYPRLSEWRRVRDAVDPDRVWQSDLSRRLTLLG